MEVWAGYIYSRLKAVRSCQDPLVADEDTAAHVVTVVGVGT